MTGLTETKKNRNIEIYTKNSDGVVLRSGAFTSDGGIVIGSAGKGSSGVTDDNIKLHRGSSGLQFVKENDNTNEGIDASLGLIDVKMRSVIIGSSSNPAENIKIKRANNNTVQFVSGNDTSGENEISSNIADVLGNIPIGSVLAWNPGYYTNNDNGSFTNASFLTSNNVEGANTYLNPRGFYVADGSVPNIFESLIWNTSGKYLPNLTNNRFLMGSISTGGIGGSNVLTDHTHTHTISASQGAHSHIQDAHGHTQNAHGHTQNSHNHSQNSHNHSQVSHNHSQNAHSHSFPTVNTPNGAGTPSQRGYQEPVVTHYTDSTTATNNATTASNNAATATNIAATATNINTTATNQTTIATNQNATPVITVSGGVGTGGAASLTENRPKYLSNFYIVRVF